MDQDPTPGSVRLRLARELLRSECAGARDREAVVQATTRVLRKLHEALRPTLGGAGYEVLLGRAIILAARRHPTLGRLPVPRDAPPPEEEVSAALPDGPDVQSAAEELVCEFLFFLARLVDWPLALALLRGAWGEVVKAYDASELEPRPPSPEG